VIRASSEKTIRTSEAVVPESLASDFVAENPCTAHPDSTSNKSQVTLRIRQPSMRRRIEPSAERVK
jgi:hypothetical protein